MILRSLAVCLFAVHVLPLRASPATPVGESPESRPARELEEGWIIKRPSLADVDYADGDEAQRLDVYFAESERPAPVVVFIHGGGWRSGSKNRVPLVLMREGQSLGIAVVSIDYRLTWAAPHPAQIDDVLRAIQFVRANARDWKIDPGRLAVMGTSAGAHLAMLAGARDDIADPHSENPVARQSSRVRCVVSYSGPTDFHLLMGEHSPILRQLLGLEPDGPDSDITEERIAGLSPIAFVTPDDPPILLCQGAADLTVSPENAKRMDARLREAKVESELVIVDSAGHNLPFSKQANDAALEFLKRHLLSESGTTQPTVKPSMGP